MRGGNEGAEDLTLAFVDVWSVVDNLWRLHQLTRRFPGLKKTPELEVQLRALGQAEDLRHGFQHAAEKLKHLARDRQALLGTLSWFWTPDEATGGGVALVAVAGSLGIDQIPMVNPIGKQFARPIGLVTLAAFGRQIELSEMLSRVALIADGLDRGARKVHGVSSGGGADMLAAVDVSFGPF
jgi:hypothetical protein